MNRTSQDPRPLSPFVDNYAMNRGIGRPIDWTKVSAYFYDVGKFTVKLNGAAAVGATSLTVDALPADVPKGTVLHFGAYAAVVATVGVAGALANATSVPVAALSGPIPSGTILDFTGTGKFAKLTADAAVGATSLAVEALPQALVSTDAATFPGGAIDAEVTADALAAATTLTVAPLEFAIANDAEALVDGAPIVTNGRLIPKGTILSLTSAGLFMPRRDGVSSSEIQSVGFLASDAVENSKSDAKSGYGLVIGGTPIYENLCPDADSSGDLPSAYKTELAANTLGFTYEDWSDTRVV